MEDKRIKITLLVLVIIFISLIGYYFDENYLIQLLRNNAVETKILYVLYVSASVILVSIPLIAAIPIVLITFGLYESIFLTIFGVLIGSVVVFFLSRFLGHHVIEKVIGKKDYDKYQDLINISTFKRFLLLRLLANNYFDLISYLGGLSEIKFSNYFLATFIGTVFWISLSFFAIEKASAYGQSFTILILGSFYVLIGLTVAFAIRKIFLGKKVKMD